MIRVILACKRRSAMPDFTSMDCSSVWMSCVFHCFSTETVLQRRTKLVHFWNLRVIHIVQFVQVPLAENPWSTRHSNRAAIHGSSQLLHALFLESIPFPRHTWNCWWTCSKYQSSLYISTEAHTVGSGILSSNKGLRSYLRAKGF